MQTIHACGINADMINPEDAIKPPVNTTHLTPNLSDNVPPIEPNYCDVKRLSCFIQSESEVTYQENKSIRS